MIRIAGNRPLIRAEGKGRKDTVVSGRQDSADTLIVVTENASRT